MKKDKQNAKTVAATINIIRDKYNKELKENELNALIIAENMIRENPELFEKYV